MGSQKSGSKFFFGSPFFKKNCGPCDALMRFLLKLMIFIFLIGVMKTQKWGSQKMVFVYDFLFKPNFSQKLWTVHPCVFLRQWPIWNVLIFLTTGVWYLSPKNYTIETPSSWFWGAQNSRGSTNSPKFGFYFLKIEIFIWFGQIFEFCLIKRVEGVGWDRTVVEYIDLWTIIIPPYHPIP